MKLWDGGSKGRKEGRKERMKEGRKEEWKNFKSTGSNQVSYACIN